MERDPGCLHTHLRNTCGCTRCSLSGPAEVLGCDGVGATTAESVGTDATRGDNMHVVGRARSDLSPEEG